MENKIKTTIEKYTGIWQSQNLLFQNIKRPNPSPNPTFINIKQLTSEERKILSGLAEKTEYDIFRAVNELLGDKLMKNQIKITSLNDAKKTLNIDLVTKIPLKETIDLRSFYFSIPAGIVNPKITIDELKWLYLNGYVPHLYWNNGKPRFHNLMWFIVDFQIKKAREEIGLGIFKKFSDYHPNFHSIQDYLKLVIYMFNSWNIGESIINLSDKQARGTGLKNEEFRTFMHGLQTSYWLNEGKTIAMELISESKLVNKYMNLIEHYRDVFALFSFAASPGDHLIDLYHNPSSRGGVMMVYEPFMRISTYNLHTFDVNTFSSHELSEKYQLLFAATDWALSMRDGVTNRSPRDVIEKYRWNKLSSDGKIPCRICGSLFVPKRKIDRTCGRSECIQKNKNLQKTKKIKERMSPIFE